MTVNGELVRTRCQEIAESLSRLEQIRTIPKETFLKDRDLQDIASYRLLVAIEAALGLCYHVAAKHLQKVPEEYADCFVILSGAKIIPLDLSQNLQRMARFRNLLVHMYWKVDDDMLYELLLNRLSDLRQFSQAIIALL